MAMTEQQAQQIAKMLEIAQAVEDCGDLVPPRFKEFAGLIRAWVRVAQRSAEAGVPFDAPPSLDPELKYMQEKVNHIFGPVAVVTMKAR
jgi:hypothetical protein